MNSRTYKMVEFKDDGTTKLTMLEVFMYKKDGKKIINWDYGDKPNCYFLLGVLDVIKQELVDEINESEEESIELD